MKDLNKVKDCLKDKLIVGIDKTSNEKEKYCEFLVIFIYPEKKQTGHVILRISFGDKKGMNFFKKILIGRYNILIKGFKNWKKDIKKWEI